MCKEHIDFFTDALVCSFFKGSLAWGNVAWHRYRLFSKKTAYLFKKEGNLYRSVKKKSISLQMHWLRHASGSSDHLRGAQESSELPTAAQESLEELKIAQRSCAKLRRAQNSLQELRRAQSSAEELRRAENSLERYRVGYSGTTKEPICQIKKEIFTVL